MFGDCGRREKNSAFSRIAEQWFVQQTWESNHEPWITVVIWLIIDCYPLWSSSHPKPTAMVSLLLQLLRAGRMVVQKRAQSLGATYRTGSTYFPFEAKEKRTVSISSLGREFLWKGALHSSNLFVNLLGNL